MRERTTERFSGRKPRQDLRRKKNHELNGLPTEYHEDGAPEYVVLPDEYNRNAPYFTDAQREAKHRARLRRMMMYLLAAGAFTVLAVTPALAKNAKGQETEATQAPIGTPAQSPAGDITPRPDTTPGAEQTTAATPSPTATPTAEPTPKPEVEGVELLYAEWVENTGESAIFRIYTRIPKKNIKEKGLLATELEIFAWLNGMRTIDDWDAINTVEASAAEFGEPSTFGSDDNGDVIVTYTGSLYWADHPTPMWNDLVTLAVCGVHQETWQLTEPSNSLTVGIGGKAYLEDTVPDSTSTP